MHLIEYIISNSVSQPFPTCGIKKYNLKTVLTRNQWNRKTTLKQYLSVFDDILKQIVLLDTY